MDKFLTTIQLQDGDTHMLRSVLTTEHVDVKDVEFYYHSLLGFQTLGVSVQVREVPESFTLSLIGGQGADIPRHFPSHDHETPQSGLDKYYGLIDHVCQMERMRVACGIGGGGGGQEEATAVPVAEGGGRPSKAASKYMSWVNHIMQQFKMAAKAEEPEEMLVAKDSETIAWIFTPVLQEIRETRGSRVITNREIGCIWVNRIGTELYPDLVVRRRFSIVDWNFQHDSSHRLARMAIEWYIDAQLLGEWEGDGISPWIQRADEELGAVLNPFKQMGPRQAFPMDPGASAASGTKGKSKEKVHPLLHIMRRLEGEVVLSPISQPELETEIVPLEKKVWNKFLSHTFRMYGIGTDVIETCWGPVDELLQMWMRGKFGIRLNVPAIFEGWQPLWNMVVTQNPTVERFVLFVDTLESYDTIKALSLSITEKYDIAARWIELFVERECVADETSSLPSAQLYADIRDWCLKYVPVGVFDNALKPASVGPVVTRLGYESHKTKKGRRVIGVRYKRSARPNTDIVTPQTTNGQSVLEMLKTEESHGFTVVAMNEIHLGTL